MRKYVLLVVLALTVVTLFAVTAAPASAVTFPPKSPGYWMNHPEAWLNGGVMIGSVNDVGGVFYPTAQAIAIMKMPNKGDMTYAVFQCVAAAEQNQANGAGPYWEGSMQAFLAAHAPGSGVSASSDAFQRIEPAYTETCAWWD